MAAHTLEREIKILVDRAGVDTSTSQGRKQIAQVYLRSGPEGTVRVRRYEGGAHELTVKLRRGPGVDSEYTFPVAGDDGPRLYQEALEGGFPEVRKTRWLFPADLDPPGLTWEVDLFEGDLAFLAVAELEYPGPDRPPGLDAPPRWYRGPWGLDVTDDRRFKNSALVTLDGAGAAALAEVVADKLKSPA